MEEYVILLPSENPRHCDSHQKFSLRMTYFQTYDLVANIHLATTLWSDPGKSTWLRNSISFEKHTRSDPTNLVRTVRRTVRVTVMYHGQLALERRHAKKRKHLATLLRMPIPTICHIALDEMDIMHMFMWSNRDFGFRTCEIFPKYFMQTV